MAKLFNFFGGGCGDGVEPYSGKRIQPPPFSFVMEGNIPRMEQGPLMASIYEYIRTEQRDGNTIWHFRFKEIRPDHEAIDLMVKHVSPNSEEW